jgi:hypothetical protein
MRRNRIALGATVGRNSQPAHSLIMIRCRGLSHFSSKICYALKRRKLGSGRFLSLSPLPDSVRALAVDNRVAFEIDGRSYQFVTGAPITREEKVWILHRASAKPLMNGIFGTGRSDALLPLLQGNN